jgi:8-oxo-dGTP diphosphatase
MESEIINKYGNRLRVRVCGLCWQGDKLLVANHKLLGDNNFWAPIGGGLEFGETSKSALEREFKEEAMIEITPGGFQFGCEYINKPLHAIELFFEVIYKSGNIGLGIDPESYLKQQILTEVRYMEFIELMALKPDERHGIFHLVNNAEDLKNLSGFYTI